jgi:hypothetical protein
MFQRFISMDVGAKREELAEFHRIPRAKIITKFKVANIREIKMGGLENPPLTKTNCL